MARRNFCELGPVPYMISVKRCQMARNIADGLSRAHFANERSEESLPYVVFSHMSPIRRILGDVDMQLQENKATNLALAAPHIDGIVIRPGETFSFWRLAGAPSKKKGYQTGLVISNGKTGADIGGGMCQMTNLIHWLVLHSALCITEHHHHDRFDLFPDHKRRVPFGTGTSIFYNYIDYRFQNKTADTYQLRLRTDGIALHGELLCSVPSTVQYEIAVENERFVQEKDGVYRLGEVYRICTDTQTGRVQSRELLRKNHAKVMYDTAGLLIEKQE